MSFLNQNNNSFNNTSSSQFGGTQMNGLSSQGGGFMSTQNENNFGSANGVQKKVVPMAERKLTPLTLKQLSTATPPDQDETLMIGDVEISQLVVIGEIKSIDVQASHTTLTINDGTANMNIKQWHNDNEDASAQTLSEGLYIKCVGRANVYNNNISVNAFRIAPITDSNEITLHFIECVYSEAMNKQIAEKQSKNAMNNMSFAGNNNTQLGNNNNNNMNMNMNNNASSSQFGNNGMSNNNNSMFSEGGGFNHDDSELTELQRRIMQIIRSYGAVDEGVNCDDIFGKMPGCNMGEIRQAIEELTTQGSIYTTVDEEHFKASV